MLAQEAGESVDAGIELVVGQFLTVITDDGDRVWGGGGLVLEQGVQSGPGRNGKIITGRPLVELVEFCLGEDIQVVTRVVGFVANVSRIFVNTVTNRSTVPRSKTSTAKDNDPWMASGASVM